MRPAILPVLLILVLYGCDGGEQRQREPARIFDTQRQALEKARDVNATVQQADQQRRAEEEAQTE